MADPPGFLQRWSRLKRAEKAAAAARGAAAPTPIAAEPVQPAAAPEDPVQDLPPLETLTGDSDFRPFMRAGVPEALRNAALRKLWASDPVYANLDGLVEYGEDFAEPFQAAGAVATVYRVLEGMPEPNPPAGEPAAPAPPPADPPAKTADAAAPASPVEPAPPEGIE